jgi:DNA-binding NarL/FixJ family response regulator
VRVVVVDNDAAALELAVLDLSLEGHEIVGTATQGADALRVVRETRPDVVVLDQRMPPGPSGIDVARQLRRDAPDARVILYTNHLHDELVRRAERLGVVYLAKGDLGALRRAVAGPAAL